MNRPWETGACFIIYGGIMYREYTQRPRVDLLAYVNLPHRFGNHGWF